MVFVVYFMLRSCGGSTEMMPLFLSKKYRVNERNIDKIEEK